MSGGRYPLAPAATVRAHREEEAARALAEAEAALAAQRAAHAQATDALAAHRAAQARARERANDNSANDVHDNSENDVHEHAVPAHALLAHASYAERLREDELALRARLADAGRSAARAAEDVRHARAALITAAGESHALERHHERWSAERARDAERAEERER